MIEERMELTLYRILSAHDSCRHLSELPLVLGDGYLYSNNRVFRNVRDVVKRLGYQFTDQDFCNYRTIPFMALPEILKQRRIPYQDTVSGLQLIERNRPGAVRVSDLDAKLRNPILHESGHCIAERILPAFQETKGITGLQAQVARMLASESFAIIAEVVAWTSCQSLLDRFFFNHSSYISATPWGNWHKNLNFIRECAGIYGYELIFKLVYFSCLHEQFLIENVGPLEFRRVLEFIVPDQKFAKSDLLRLRRVFYLYYSGNGHASQRPTAVRFRKMTANFYFTYTLGLNGSLEQFLDFDFMTIFENSSSLRGRLDLMVEFTELGLSGPRSDAITLLAEKPRVEADSQSLPSPIARKSG
jgi:hypothetical protein